MAMQTTGDNTEGEPMMEINTTPLIDVMLVLLIMLIITIPIQTHAVKLDLPQNQDNPTPPPVEPIKNKVVITAGGAVLWNGTPVSLTQLRQYLDISQQMNPVPELHLQPEPNARYETVDQVLAVTKQAHVEKMGFVGNEGLRQLLERAVPVRMPRAVPTGRPFRIVSRLWRLGNPRAIGPRVSQTPDFAVVILAAGQGTRMRSDMHKVLHPIAGRPLLLHLLDRVDGLGAQKRVVVVGKGREQVEAALDGRDDDGRLPGPAEGHRARRPAGRPGARRL